MSKSACDLDLDPTNPMSDSFNLFSYTATGSFFKLIDSPLFYELSCTQHTDKYTHTYMSSIFAADKPQLIKYCDLIHSAFKHTHTHTHTHTHATCHF